MTATLPKQSTVREGDGEAPVKLPPTVQINKLSDKFKEALARPDKPAETPADKTTEKPAATAGDKAADKTAAPKTDEAKLDAAKEPKIPREHFKALETQRDEFKTKWEAAETRAKEVEARAKELETKVPTDYEELKSKLTEHEQMAQKFYVEQSDQFKAAFDHKISSGIEEAKEAVGAGNAERIADLLSMPPSARRDAEIDEITADLTPFRQAALVRAFSEVRKLQKERAAELAKPKENYKRLKEVEQREASQSKLERQAALERAFKVTALEASRESVLFKKIDGNEDHNQRVAENEKMLKEFTMNDLAPDDHARMAAWAVRGLRSVEIDAAKDAMIAKLEAELRSIQEANPALAGGGKSGGKARSLTVAEKYRQAQEQGIPQS